MGGVGDDVLLIDAEKVHLRFYADDGNELVQFAKAIKADVIINGDFGSTLDHHVVSGSEYDSTAVALDTGGSIAFAKAEQAKSIR